MRESLILSALPTALGRNSLGEDIWSRYGSDIVRDYVLDRPVSVTRIRDGDLNLVFALRQTELDGADLVVTVDPCWSKVRDAGLDGPIKSAHRLNGRH